MHTVRLRWGDVKGFDAVLYLAVNIQVEQMTKGLEMAPSSKVATGPFWQSHRGCKLSLLHHYWKRHCTTFAPGFAPHLGLSKSLVWHTAGEAPSPAREPSTTQHSTFQSDKPRADSKMLSLCKLLMVFPVNIIIIIYGLWAGKHTDIIQCLLKGQVASFFPLFPSFHVWKS